MSQPGFTVMVNDLSGGRNRGRETLDGAKGKTIASIGILPESESVPGVRVTFTEGPAMLIRDVGQSCCESRYVTTDDTDLAYWNGSEFLDIEIADAPGTTGEYGEEHEIQFLNIKTSKGVVTFSTHVEYNGYYGGFSIFVEWEKSK